LSLEEAAERRDRFYTEFYKNGGWSYEYQKELKFFQKYFKDKLHLPKGAAILELGCGLGYQAYVLADMGFDVVAMDANAQAIVEANKLQSKAHYICDSADNIGNYYGEATFDMIYVRGMSWYHYELDQLSESTGVDVREKTAYFFNYLKPGGLFFLQIATDFSGLIKNHVRYNKLTAYQNLFEKYGEIIHLTNWSDIALESQEQAERVKNNILICTQKPSS